MGWENDQYVLARQRENADALAQAQQSYEAIANQRLQNAAKGEWSPWLAIKQNVIEHAQLMPAERAAQNAPASGYATGYSEDRDARWEQAMAQADAIAEGKRKAPLKRFSAK